MTFPDNEFITFIEHPSKIFSRLVNYFKTTLAALFIALLYTIAVYIYATYNKENSTGSKILFCIFIFLFTYSLFATALAVKVTLKLTISRATYLFQKKDQETNDDESNNEETETEIDEES